MQPDPKIVFQRLPHTGQTLRGIWTEKPLQQTLPKHRRPVGICLRDCCRGSFNPLANCSYLTKQSKSSLHQVKLGVENEEHNGTQQNLKDSSTSLWVLEGSYVDTSPPRHPWSIDFQKPAKEAIQLLWCHSTARGPCIHTEHRHKASSTKLQYDKHT